MKKLVIFDLDGTLLNTIDDLGDAANYVMRHYGYPEFTSEEYKYKVGHGIRKLVERALPQEHRTSQEVDEATALFMPYYELHKADKTCPYSGIPQTLMALQMKGVRIAVATNKAQKAVEGLMRYYFPQIHFLATIGQSDRVPAKPDPTIVHEIIRRAGLTKDEVLYVGDSNVDMETARNAGVEACGVTWGFRKREELEAYRPAHIIDKPEQILELL